MQKYSVVEFYIRVSARKGTAGMKRVFIVKDELGRSYCEEDTREKAAAHITQLVAADARNAAAEAAHV